MDKAAWVRILTGKVFDDVELLRFRGSGGFALVFEGRIISSGDMCAVKVLIPGSHAQFVAEFQRESRLLTKIKRVSNVVEIDGVGQGVVEVSAAGGITVDLSVPYMRLELADGALNELVMAPQEMEWVDKFLLWRDAVLGVHQMHLKGIVHRDIKTENCLVFDLPGQKARVLSKVADLGRSRDLALPAEHGADQYMIGLGDLSFAPPEFIWGQGNDSETGHRCADLYGLGSLLFEIVMGIGITSHALSPTGDDVMRNLQNAKAGVQTDLSGLRGQYTSSIREFESVLPNIVARDAAELLKTLCHPVPSERLRIVAGGRRRRSTASLEWLLRRADILTRRLRSEAKSNTKPELAGKK